MLLRCRQLDVMDYYIPYTVFHTAGPQGARFLAQGAHQHHVQRSASWLPFHTVLGQSCICIQNGKQEAF